MNTKFDIYHSIMLLAALFFGIVVARTFAQMDGQHFIILAQSFLAGRLDLLRNDQFLGALDTVLIDGRYYWHLGPLPAVVMLPFIWVAEHGNVSLLQSYFQVIFTGGIFVLCYLLARKFSFVARDAFVLAFVFVFASVYTFIALNTQSWYFSQSVVTLLAMAAMYEYYSRRRYLIIGLLLAAILGSRISASAGILFFILSLARDRTVTPKQKRIGYIQLLLPIVGMLLLLGAYNFARFGSPWETGYHQNTPQPESLVTIRDTIGLLSLEHVPTNLYWYFMAPPMPVLEEGTYHLVFPFFRANAMGMSIFLVAPFFLLLFRRQTKLFPERSHAWITVGIILANALVWYATGYVQVGPRHLVDALPFLYLLLLASFDPRRLRPWHYALAIASALINFYFILTLQ